jgi:hypothetical protein
MTRLAVVLVSVGCIIPGIAAADPLIIGSGRFGGESAGSGPSIQLGLQPEFFMEFPWTSFGALGPELFKMTVTSADVGRPFRVSADTDPNFATAVAVLTNGIDDYIGVGFRFADGFVLHGSMKELGMFGRRPGTGAPDFSGFTITALTLRFNDFELLEFPSNGFSAGRGVRVDGLLSVEGFADTAPVPEPATLTLLGAGLAGVALRARRRRNHPD